MGVPAKTEVNFGLGWPMQWGGKGEGGWCAGPRQKLRLFVDLIDMNTNIDTNTNNRTGTNIIRI